MIIALNPFFNKMIPSKTSEKVVTGKYKGPVETFFYQKIDPVSQKFNTILIQPIIFKLV